MSQASEGIAKQFSNAIMTNKVWGGIVANVKAYGAEGDGETDDTKAIEKALQSGQPVVGVEGETYRITRTISVDSCNIAGNLKLAPSGAFMALDVGPTTAAATTTLAADVLPRATSITVTSSAGIVAGQIIKLVSSALWDYDNRGTLTKGELHVVKAVIGTTIELTEPVWDEYYVASETVTVNVYNMVNPVTINGLTIDYGSDTGITGMRIRNLFNPVLTNLKIRKATVCGLTVSQCYGATINSPSMIECFSADEETGYGIQDSGSFGTIINAGYFYRNRRGVDFSGGYPSRGGIVSNSRAICFNQTEGDGFGTHGTAEFITFIGNQTFGGRYGFIVRGSNISIKSNKIWGPNTTGISHADGDGIVVDGNEYYGSLNGRTFNPSAGLSNFYNKTFSSADNRGPNIVQGNKAFGLRQRFISISQDDSHLIIKDNICQGHSNSTGADVAFIDSNSARIVSNSLFKNNTLRVTNGIRRFWGANITIDKTTDFDERVLQTADLEQWAGTGAISNVVVDVKVTKVDGLARVVGVVRFDVITNTVKLRLKSVPRAEKESWGKLFKRDTLTDVLYWHPSAANELFYISADTTAYSTSFNVGTGYEIHIDVSYRTQNVNTYIG